MEGLLCVLYQVLSSNAMEKDLQAVRGVCEILEFMCRGLTPFLLSLMLNHNIFVPPFGTSLIYSADIPTLAK